MTPTGDPVFDAMTALADRPPAVNPEVPLANPDANPAAKPEDKVAPPVMVQFPGDKEPPPANTPAAPTPDAPPTNDNPANTPSFDEVKALNVMFGERFKTKKEIEEALTAYDTLKNAKPQNPFASEYVQQLNDYIAKGGTPEVFNRVRSVDLKAATPLEKVSLQMQWENGFSKEDADFLASRKYRTNDTEISETDKREADLNLQRDAKIATDFINKEISTALIPEPQLKISERANQWNTALPSVIEELKEFTFKGTTGIEFKVPLSKETLAHLKTHFETIIQHPDVDILPNAEGKAWAKDVLMREILLKEYSNFLNTAITQTELRHVKEKNNPAALNERDPKTVTQKQTNAKEFAQFLTT